MADTALGKSGEWQKSMSKNKNPLLKENYGDLKTSEVLNQLFSRKANEDKKEVVQTSTLRPRKSRVPKVDWLDSERGLEKVYKTVLRDFTSRGKGHEKEDLRQFLEIYVKWHQESFPKIEFQEFLTKIERFKSSKAINKFLRVKRSKNNSAFSELAKEIEPLEDIFRQLDQTMKAYEVQESNKQKVKGKILPEEDFPDAICEDPFWSSESEFEEIDKT